MKTPAFSFVDDKAAAAWEAQTALPCKQLQTLTPEFIHAAADYLGFSDELRADLLDGLQLFTQHPELVRLLGQFEQLIASRTLAGLTPPTVPADCHPSARLFPIYALLSGLDAIRAYHRSLSVAEAVTHDTLSDLLLWINHHKEYNGRFGLSQLNWLRGHFTGKLFKLGRLQFQFETFNQPFAAYRHRQTRKLILLCESGAQFRADGQFADADGLASSVAWIAELAENAQTIRGMAVHPKGVADSEPVTLEKVEWDCVLKRSDPVLGIHIPATGSIDHAACGQSFARAMEFFPAHFPDQPFKAFNCASWLLDPQLADHLPNTSNISLFLKEFFLHPCPGANANQTFERVFGFNVKPDADLKTLPRKSSLQRQILWHLEAGGRWRSGGALLFPEDIDWGSQFYWRQVNK